MKVKPGLKPPGGNGWVVTDAGTSSISKWHCGFPEKPDMKYASGQFRTTKSLLRFFPLSLIRKSVVAGFSIILSSCYSVRHLPQEKYFPTALSPVFVVPDCDSANPIQLAWYAWNQDSTDDILEISLVFRDEDQPIHIADWLYDAYRELKYHRKKDIETLFVHLDKGSQAFKGIDFGDAYSGLQVFNKPFVKHYHAIVPRDCFEMHDGRPLIYINTWNHMLSESDNNPSLSKHADYSFKKFPGTRAEAEIYGRANKSGVE